MTAKILEIDGVAFQWPGRHSFSLEVPEFVQADGESVLLLGKSGSGKSTLLSLICGTVLPDKGELRVAGRAYSELSVGARDKFRAETIGVIFQQFNLLPFGTVADNILLPLKFAPSRRKRAGDARQTALDLCAALGLPKNVFDAPARTLSVGQQQRVAVARALIGQPPLIVADEPTSALDEDSQEVFLDLLFDQTRAQKASLLMVSHDPRLATRFDRTVHMDEIVKMRRDAA